MANPLNAPPVFRETDEARKLLEQIYDRRSPRGFSLINLGDGRGDILFYRGQYSRVKEFIIDLRQGKDVYYLDNQSKVPYFMLVAQDEQGKPADLIIYHTSHDPILEYSVGDHPLVGQILAYSISPDGNAYTVAHAIYSPVHSDIFAVVDREFSSSTAVVSYPELCKHLLLCGGSIFRLMNLLDKKSNLRENG